MSAQYGGIVAIQSRQSFYGIQAQVKLPVDYGVQGPDKHNYFDAYLGFANPTAGDDPRVEAGIFKYGNRQDWTLFLWSLGKGGWHEQNISYPAGGEIHFKLIFAHNDPTRVSFYANGRLMWTSIMGRPVSAGTYDAGGLAMKACLGMDDELKTVYFDRMEMSNIQVCEDKGGTKWSPITQGGYQNIIKNPAPTALSWCPLAASYMKNKKFP